ncbi:Ctr copper transporter-like protein [Sporormia fimetaria CBS 119925]|uniref:Copper transport protein n=1 Tax=Sporormia fimetaria CBS 119925 TaxID=1340428 RepID=A0A6A6VGZ3_9PLEO|nr:Ctr copper transporter-like protein [Sporormia fimetaria CBS 119925]
MVAHNGMAHDAPISHASDSSMSHGGSSSHSMMNMVFFTASNTPLYANSWTPSSAGAYAGTCIFLIVLAVLFRTLFTLRAHLEAKWIESAMKRRYVIVEGQGANEKITSEDTNSMTGILTANGLAENVRIVQAPVKHIQPWRFGVDIPRSLITTVAVAVGYLLMLAVMTFNVGYFLSVLAGAFIGELAFGRFYHQGVMIM